MNRTELRHRVLSAVADGHTYEYRLDNLNNETWKYCRLDGLPFGNEIRTVNQFATAGYVRAVLQLRLLAPRPVRLTLSGQRLLSEWDAKHGAVDRG